MFARLRIGVDLGVGWHTSPHVCIPFHSPHVHTPQHNPVAAQRLLNSSCLSLPQFGCALLITVWLLFFVAQQHPFLPLVDVRSSEDRLELTMSQLTRARIDDSYMMHETSLTITRA